MSNYSFNFKSCVLQIKGTQSETLGVGGERTESGTWRGRSVVQAGLRPTQGFFWLVQTFAHLQDTKSSLPHCSPPGGDMELVYGRSAGLLNPASVLSLSDSLRLTTPADGQISVVHIEGKLALSFVSSLVIPTDRQPGGKADISSWCTRQTRWRLLVRFKSEKFIQATITVARKVSSCISPSPGGRQAAPKGLSVELTWSCCPTWNSS